jgi:hypothetical protein
MDVVVRAFRLPKDGNGPEQCDDAWAVAPDRNRFAAADGASDSFRSGRWAQQLADAFVQAPFAAAAAASDHPNGAASRLAFDEWIRPFREGWARATDEEWDRLPWYAQRKAAKGGHTTLVGLELLGDRWTAVAVGDSCLFHLRDGRLLVPFPLDDPAQFDTSPDLIPTEAPNQDRASPVLRSAEGDVRQSDVFILATDALACWALGTQAKDPWQTLTAVRDDGAFEQLVAILRKEQAVRNDDMTLLVVEVGPMAAEQTAQANAGAAKGSE